MLGYRHHMYSVLQYMWKQDNYKDTLYKLAEDVCCSFMVIGLIGVQFGLKSYEWLAKSDDHRARICFINQECDYDWKYWMTQSPVTNELYL